MEFLPQDISDYTEKYTQEESTLLKELNRETHLKILTPRMLSGHLQGRVLSLISKLMRPKYILEIGTYTGYAALCMAEGLTEGGQLITIDRNEELKPILEKYLLQSNVSNQVDLRFGNAIDIIPTLEDGIDLVFIDADKPNYSNYFDLVIDKMNPGGLILADNVLWSGKVTGEIKPNDKSTHAIHAFNQKVHADNRVENVLLPIRDGIMALRKKEN